jgi:hypothetical protein
MPVPVWHSTRWLCPVRRWTAACERQSTATGLWHTVPAPHRRLVLGPDGSIALAVFCPALQRLSIGAENHVGAAAQDGPSGGLMRPGGRPGPGALAIAEHCTALLQLELGNENGLGEAGALALAKCTALTHLAIGTDVRAPNSTSIVPFPLALFVSQFSHQAASGVIKRSHFTFFGCSSILSGDSVPNFRTVFSGLLLLPFFLLRIGTEFFLAILWIVEFYLLKDSNYSQNTFKNLRRFAPTYISPPRDCNFSRHNKDWDSKPPSPNKCTGCALTGTNF